MIFFFGAMDMKVAIRKDAKQAYINYTVITFRLPYANEYAETMDRLAGRICEVDTENLFPDSFNVIDPDTEADIIHVHCRLVEDVIYDLRPYMMKCQYCGTTQEPAAKCERCGCDKSMKYVTSPES